MDKKLLSVAEASVIMGISRSLLYSLVMSGEVRSLKIGRARRIPLTAIDEFIEEQHDPDATEERPVRGYEAREE